MNLTITIDGKALRPLLRTGALVALLGVLGYPAWVVASQATIPHTFQKGGLILASDFNEDFEALRAAVSDNDTRIGSLSNLQTTAKGDLVSALNEVKSTAGAQGPQGPQGPAGPSLLRRVFAGSAAPGGGTDQIAAGTVLAFDQQFRPASQVAGRPYTATIRLQTVDATAGHDKPGAPIAAGNVVLDVEWQFFVGSDANTATTVTQSAVATIVLDAGVNNDKTVTFSGTAPSAPTTAGGFTTSTFGALRVKTAAATTAMAQADTTAEFDITLP
jgi:hypothetical protein